MLATQDSAQETHSHREEAPETNHDQTEETPKDPEETDQKDDKAMDLKSVKRKSDEPFQLAEKKLRLNEEIDLCLTKDYNKPSISDKITEKSISREENHDVTLRPVMQEYSRETIMKRLEELESERNKLQQILGLEIIKKSQGTMTQCPNEEKTAVSTKEIGCQADLAEKSVSCGSKTQVPKPHEAMIQRTLVNCGFGKSEQQKERNENFKSTGNENHNATLALDELHGIRSNVVVLLTTLLPQLDLSGISLETTDVDNILQQIIEVNELKL
ncbi:hypothetical protein WMY93_009309 [Mugilogobius chulae]|uniref:Uncharacterized protein n=1 Tax=Mugilogobius chulae TaxID=88201 RepID=A0AAW0PGC6_9GOBI